jgi:hypothetical protein
MNNSIKSLPLTNLTVVAFAHVSTEVAHAGEENDFTTEVEYEVYNQAAFDRIPSGGLKSANRCSCCGHAIKYACVIEHTPTLEIFFVGRDCARKIESLKNSPLVANLDRSSVALAERALCAARERDVRSKFPQAVAALDWAKTGVNRTAKDIADKIRRFGNPSGKQIEFLVKMHIDDTVRRSTATGTVPSGRQTLTAKVISAKLVNSDFGVQVKLLLDLGNGVKVYGNGGKTCYKVATPFMGDKDELLVKAGDSITMTATFNASPNDNLFGFFSRPSKMVISK